MIAIAAISIISVGTATAQTWHSEEDTERAMALVREFHDPGGDPSEKAGPIAERLIGTEYRNLTMEDSTGHLQIRMDAFDDMGFLNTVVALARLATSPGHKRPEEFENAIREVTFRRGVDNGFPTRMVYAADWVVDNKSRGIIKEMTEIYSDQFKTKSLDYVTRHRDLYRALADSATYEEMKMVEMGFRTHKIPHMRRESSDWKDIAPALRDGDIIMLLTPDNTTDVLEIGIIRRRDDGFHYIHPSETAGKVVEEPEPLGRYIKRNAKKVYGYRWLRLAQ